MSKQTTDATPPLTVNSAQADHWNGAEGHHWATEHTRYDAMLGPFGDRALDAAAIQPGEHVLDVGCGAGGLALSAAQLVGPRGRVVGIDLSEPMIDAARRRAADAGLGNVEFVAADAQTYGFDEGAFDTVVSRFGAMFFGDPIAAFTNLARALRPGGRLASVSWQDPGASEWMMAPAIAALEHVPAPEPAAFDALSPFGLADPKRITEVLEAAGLNDIALARLERPLQFGGGGAVEDAVVFFRDGGMGQTLLAGASPGETAAALAAVADVFATRLTAHGVELGAAAWLVTATTPRSCPVR